MKPQYGQVVCKECGVKGRVWVESLAYKRQLCPTHLGSPIGLLSEVMQKYFGIHGRHVGYASGLFIIEATSPADAAVKLAKLRVDNVSYHDPQVSEIKGEWAKVLSDTIDAIRNRETVHYVNLDNGVYYVEI